MSVKMIVSDLDNTLLRRDKSVSAYTEGVLCRCQAKGIRVAFATARTARATKRFWARFAPDYVIADNGAAMYQGETALHTLPIPAAVRDALIARFLAAREVTLITVETGACLFTNYDGPPWEPGWNPVYTDFTQDIRAEATKLSVACEDEAFLSGVLRDYPDLHRYANSGEGWHQIMRGDATKENAIRHLSERLGMGPGDIAAFGDDCNDIGMLTHCGVGVAVANAIDGAKAAADFVCGANDEDGVATWIEKNIL